MERGVLAGDGVAERGVIHGAPHLGRRQGHGIAAQVNDGRHGTSHLVCNRDGAYRHSIMLSRVRWIVTSRDGGAAGGKVSIYFYLIEVRDAVRSTNAD